MHYPEAMESLIAALKQLPGIGRRGAERLALSLLEWEPEKLEFLGTLLGTRPQTVGTCPECGALADAGQLCAVCREPQRDPGIVCVVETMAQMFAIESSGNFRGRYHVLGGRISPMEAETGAGLNLPRLLERARSGSVREVILALSSDVEGRATAVYIAGLLRELPVRVTQPALGLPAGANLSYADGATITAALSGRTEVK